jgi:hypothetical protein
MPSTTYFWAITALDIYGLESDYSNEATNVTPAKAIPPGQFNVNTTIPPN